MKNKQTWKDFCRRKRTNPIKTNQSKSELEKFPNQNIAVFRAEMSDNRANRVWFVMEGNGRLFRHTNGWPRRKKLKSQAVCVNDRKMLRVKFESFDVSAGKELKETRRNENQELENGEAKLFGQCLEDLQYWTRFFTRVVERVKAKCVRVCGMQMAIHIRLLDVRHTTNGRDCATLRFECWQEKNTWRCDHDKVWDLSME